MKWFATELIKPCIEKTKSILFPIKFKLWLKLALLIILAGAIRGGSSPNLRIPSGVDFSTITNFMQNYLTYLIIGFVFLVILGFVAVWMSCVFRFCLLESIYTKTVHVLRYFKKYMKQGWSFFLFTIVIGLISLIILGALSLPLVIPIIKNFSNLSWSIISIPYLVFFITFFILWIIVYGIFTMLMTHYVLADMYLNKIKSSYASFKRMFYLLKKELKQSLLYWLMLFLLGIASAIIFFIAAILAAIPFLIIALILALFFVGLWALANSLLVILIILGVIIGVILISAYIFAIVLVTVPIPVFFVNYQLSVVQELIKKNKFSLNRFK